LEDLVAIGFLRLEVNSLKHEASGRVAKTIPNVKHGAVPFRIPWMANVVRTTAPADSMMALGGGTFLMGSAGVTRKKHQHIVSASARFGLMPHR
jgi:hypothetical protein